MSFVSCLIITPLEFESCVEWCSGDCDGDGEGSEGRRGLGGGASCLWLVSLGQWREEER